MNLISAELRRVNDSKVSTLLVSGSVDFSTPAEFATEELLPSLEHGQQVILREFGHVKDVFDLRPAAIERLLVSFFNTGVADDSLFGEVSMRFSVSLGLPMSAKLTLAAFAVLLLGLGALLTHLVLR